MPVITVPVLDTPRLRLRAVRAEDAHAICAYGCDPEVTQYVSWPQHRSLDDATAYLTGMVREGRLAAWAVFPNLDGAAGDCWCYARVRR